MYRKSTLDNGVRVVTEHMPGMRSVSIGVLVDAGPRDEKPSQHGLAHLTEHMLFQGTSMRDLMQIAHLMDAAGGQINAFTTRDYTFFSATVLDDYHTYVLDLFGDILLNSIFPEERLKCEQGAVLREIQMAADNPSERACTLLKAQAWGQHPLGRSIAGEAATVRSLTREDVIYFNHKNYLPDRTIIAIAGGVAHEDMVANVRDSFWRMLGKSKPVQTPTPDSRPGVVVENRDLSQSYFAIGIPVQAYNDGERYTLHVLNSMLGGGISSRLSRQLRERRGLVYDIGSEVHAYQDAGIIMIEGSTAPEHLLTVIQLVLLEFGRIVLDQSEVQDDELWKTKKQIRSQHLMGNCHTSTVMSRLATQEFYFNRNISSDEILSEIEAVGVHNLRAYCGNLLTKGMQKICVAVVGPDAHQLYDKEKIIDVLNQFNTIDY